MTDAFGRDTYCLDSLRTGRLVGGVLVVAQNAFHRLITPTGKLRGGEEEEKYGFDLASKIGSTATDAEIASLPTDIRNELTEDPRIVDVTTTIAREQVGPSVALRLTIVGYTDAGPFTLVVGVANTTVSLLGVSEGAA